MSGRHSSKTSSVPVQAVEKLVNAAPREDSASLTAPQISPVKLGDDFPAWKPEEVGVFQGEDGKWYQPYGSRGQYVHTYDHEPACSLVDTKISRLLGESGVAWSTFREIVRLQASHNAEVNARDVDRIVSGIHDVTVCKALLESFLLREDNEKRSSAGWGGAGGNCNMLGIYGAAVRQLQMRLQRLLSQNSDTYD